MNNKIKLLLYILILYNLYACSRFSLLVPSDRVIKTETGYLMFWGNFTYFAPVKIDTSANYYLNDLLDNKKLDLYYFSRWSYDDCWFLINRYGECFHLKDTNIFMNSSPGSRQCDRKIGGIGYLIPVRLTYYVEYDLSPSRYAGKDLFTDYYSFNDKKVRINVNDIEIAEILEGAIVRISRKKLDLYRNDPFIEIDTMNKN